MKPIKQLLAKIAEATTIIGIFIGFGTVLLWKPLRWGINQLPAPVKPSEDVVTIAEIASFLLICTGLILITIKIFVLILT